MWIYLAVLSVIFAVYALKKYIRILSFIFSLDGPKTVPILGNVNIMLKENLLTEMAYAPQNYGRIIRIWLTVVPYVVLTEPEDIQAVLSNVKHTQKIFFYKLLDNFLGKGLLTREGHKWKIHRKMLQPVFHLHMLEKFIKMFNEHADVLVNKLLDKNGENVNVTTLVNNSVYDILRETVLGMTSQRSNDDEDDTPFRKGQVMMLYRFARPWLLIDWIYRLTEAGRSEKRQQKALYEFCLKKMKEKREFLRKNAVSDNETRKDTCATRKMCLLEYLVEISERNPFFSEQDIIEECCTFMLAGQESVATAVAITLFFLANNPKCQKKCIDELDQIFGNDNRLPTMADLKEMNYLDMCIKESLRLYPSVPIFARTVSQDVKIGKYVIPAGCGVFISPYMTHRLSHHFPDPYSFKPERFSPENSKTRHPYAFIPFSAGPRNCIGYKFAMLEMKSVISAVLRKCRLESVTGKEEIIAKFRMTIRAQGGLWVKVRARD